MALHAFSTQSIERMNKLNLSVNSAALQSKLDELGEDYDAAVLDWAKQGTCK